MQDNLYKIFGNISTTTHVLCRSTAQQKTLLTWSNLLRMRHKFLVQIKLCNSWPMHLPSGVHIFPIRREPIEDTLCTTLHKNPEDYYYCNTFKMRITMRLVNALLAFMFILFTQTPFLDSFFSSSHFHILFFKSNLKVCGVPRNFVRRGFYKFS